MTTMLEKMACALYGEYATAQQVKDAGEWDYCLGAARQALMAIREPTVAIHNAACDSAHQSRPPGVELTEDGLVRIVGFRPASPGHLFTAMIDAILNEKTP